jgi:GNAT superfamily N-acetyltransferase
MNKKPEFERTMNILQDTSRNSLIRSIEQNFIEYRLHFSRLPHGQCHHSGQVSWLNSGIPFLSWNGIVETHLADSGSDLEIIKLVEQLKTLKFPAGWWITPRSTPADLPDRLLNLGFEHVGDYPAMASILQQAPSNGQANADLELREISLSCDLDITIKLIKNCFQLPPYCLEALLNLFYVDFISDHPCFRHFVGFVNNVPVAIASLFRAAGVAGFYFVGTIPEFRRRGIGTDIIAHSLAAAADEGFRIAALRASQMGAEVYRKLGFREYFQFRLFSPKPTVFKPIFWKFSYYTQLVYNKFCGDTLWF